VRPGLRPNCDSPRMELLSLFTVLFWGFSQELAGGVWDGEALVVWLVGSLTLRIRGSAHLASRVDVLCLFFIFF
jgi:hypothetical protein